VGGTLINKRSLSVFGTQLFSGLSTIVTALLAFSTPSTTMSEIGHVCELTAVQASTIQSLLADRNATCIMNMTIGSILN
jgi:hypothetical protein